MCCCKSEDLYSWSREYGWSLMGLCSVSTNLFKLVITVSFSLCTRIVLAFVAVHNTFIKQKGKEKVF